MNSISRRRAVAGVAGAAGLAAIPVFAGSRAGTGTGVATGAGMGTGAGTGMGGSRMPVVFFPHGGGPWPFVDLGMDPREVDSLAGYMRSIRAVTATPPKAVLVVSAHWEEAVPTVMTAERPSILYDYYGFPADSYRIQWPAPGSPKLASRVRELLGSAGFKTAADDTRGFDHGTFIPLKLTWPEAELPTIQLSMLQSLDPAEHLRMGRALAPLRDEGVLILGSGMSFHNLRAMFGDPRARETSETFDAWLRQTALLRQAERSSRLTRWMEAPAARAAHPREEHLLPMMVIAGAAGDDAASIPYSESFMGVRISAVQYG